MKKIEPADVIGDNFTKLLDLQPASIVMYCLLASFAVSPTGMLKNYNPKGNTLPLIEISSSLMKELPLSVQDVFLSIFELAGFGLLEIAAMENNSFYVILNPIPERLVSNGLFDGFIEHMIGSETDD